LILVDAADVDKIDHVLCQIGLLRCPQLIGTREVAADEQA
jgi:hypothetical protein